MPNNNDHKNDAKVRRNSVLPNITVALVAGFCIASLWTIFVVYHLQKTDHGFISRFQDARRLGARSRGSIVIAGQFVAGDMSCNIAQMDLDTNKWIPKGKLILRSSW